MVEDCLRSFIHTHGLLCKHVVQRYLERSTPIPLFNASGLCLFQNSSENLTKESPRTYAVNHVHDSYKILTDAHIPAFLSVWEKLAENPVLEVTNPNMVARKPGRHNGFKNKVSEKRDKLAWIM
jgi:hypothetical protein